MKKKPVALKRRADRGPVYLRVVNGWTAEFSDVTHPDLSDELRYVYAGEVYDARHLRDYEIDNVMVAGGYVERFKGDLADLSPKEARWLIANGDVVPATDKPAPTAKKDEPKEEAN